MATSVPARVLTAVRPTASPGLLAGAASQSVVFTATAFLVSDVIDLFGVGVGTAGLISTAQLGGFSIANLSGGRWLRPSRQLAIVSMGVAAAANLASAASPNFSVLVVLRFLSGLAMGLFTLVSWSESADDSRRRGEIAAIGPLAAALAAPVVAVLSDHWGLRGTYLLLAATAAAVMVLPIEVRPVAGSARNPIQTRGVPLVLLGLLMFSAGGSGVWVFSRVMSERLGMSTVVLSLAFSANALLSLPAARFAGRRRLPGAWMAVTATCALVVTQTDKTWVMVACLAVWGAGFWAAIPEVFNILADRSIHPADRVGDAQAAMAIGRVAGPSMGGLLVGGGTGAFDRLGIVASVTMLTAGGIIQMVTSSHRILVPKRPDAR